MAKHPIRDLRPRPASGAAGKPAPKGGSSARGGDMGKWLALSALPVVFCWLYGLPALVAGAWVLYQLLPMRHTALKWKGRPGMLYQLSLASAVTGTALAALFTIYHTLALSHGAYFR